MSSPFLKAQDAQVIGFTESEEGKWKAPYFFIFATDTQPGFMDIVDGGDGSKWEKEIMQIKDSLLAINLMSPKPKFVILGGDQLQDLPGEKYREAQLKDLEQAFSVLDKEIPILLVGGNHDVGRTPTIDTMAEYNEKFGDDYFSFWCGGIYYLVLNSQYWYDDSETKELSFKHEKWFQAQIKRMESMDFIHAVLFLHIPIFLCETDEDDCYFNIPKKRRLGLIQEVVDAGFSRVFSGHYHRNCGGMYTKTYPDGTTKTVEMIVSSALGQQLGDDNAGIRVVKVLKNSIEHQYYDIKDIPQTIQL